SGPACPAQNQPAGSSQRACQQRRWRSSAQRHRKPRLPVARFSQHQCVLNPSRAATSARMTLITEVSLTSVRPTARPNSRGDTPQTPVKAAVCPNRQMLTSRWADALEGPQRPAQRQAPGVARWNDPPASAQPYQRTEEALGREEEGAAAETAGDSAATRDDRGAPGAAAPASPDGSVAGSPGTEAPAAGAPGRSRPWRLTGVVGPWVSIFAGSMGLFTVRFLVPVPVGTANNGDGARLMCAFGVAPVTGGHLSEFKYAYFQFDRAPSACAHAHLYPSSQHLLLVVAQWLTPVLGLPGRINLIALGVLTCAIASFAIASLATGLRVNIWARLA